MGRGFSIIIICFSGIGDQGFVVQGLRIFFLYFRHVGSGPMGLRDPEWDLRVQ